VDSFSDMIYLNVIALNRRDFFALRKSDIEAIGVSIVNTAVERAWIQVNGVVHEWTGNMASAAWQQLMQSMPFVRDRFGGEITR
jgi:hypothetical protein